MTGTLKYVVALAVVGVFQMASRSRCQAVAATAPDLAPEAAAREGTIRLQSLPLCICLVGTSFILSPLVARGWRGPLQIAAGLAVVASLFVQSVRIERRLYEIVADERARARIARACLTERVALLGAIAVVLLLPLR